MFRTMLKSEIHRATVTRTDPRHAGAVTVDPVLMEAADLLPGERVAVVDVANGARLETYVVAGERGSGVLAVSGAAPGDRVVLISYGLVDGAEAASRRPRVVVVDERNRVVEAGTDPAAAPGVGGPTGGAEPPAEPTAETAEAALLDALLQPEN